jgi:hypothetical protein
MKSQFFGMKRSSTIPPRHWLLVIQLKSAIGQVVSTFNHFNSNSTQEVNNNQQDITRKGKFAWHINADPGPNIRLFVYSCHQIIKQSFIFSILNLTCNIHCLSGQAKAFITPFSLLLWFLILKRAVASCWNLALWSDSPVMLRLVAQEEMPRGAQL